MKQLMVMVCLVLLVGCETEQQAQERYRAHVESWMQFCRPAFNEAQCNVLLAVKDSADAAKAAANDAATGSAIATGMAAGAMAGSTSRR